MNDSISRRAALDMVNHLTEIYVHNLPPMLNKADVYNNVRLLPTVDAIKVVRCKDCKHRHLDGMIWNCPFGLSGGEDFFCAYGAKDGEQND